MDPKLQIGLIVAAVVVVLLGHAGSLWSAVKSGAAKFQRKAAPASVPAVASISARIDAFLAVKPFVRRSEASALWMRLEPDAPTLPEPTITTPVIVETTP